MCHHTQQVELDLLAYVPHYLSHFYKSGTLHNRRHLALYSITVGLNTYHPPPPHILCLLPRVGI